MSIFTKIALGSAPDSGGSETLNSGFDKINNNYLAAESAAAPESSGASHIGYDNAGTPTNVQDFLDALTFEGTVTADNIGSSTGDYVDVFSSKVANELQFREIHAGSNVTVEYSGSDIVINSTASASNTAEVTLINTGASSALGANDEVILIDTRDAAYTFTLTAGVDKRIVLIKNLAWTGTGATATPTSAEVTIAADSGEYVEDDRSGLPATTTAIGPGSAMRIVFDTTTSVWCII